MCIFDRNNWIRLSLFALLCYGCICCGSNAEQESPAVVDCEQWTTLRSAFNTLLKEDYDAFLEFVDTAQNGNMDGERLKQALRQKYARENYNPNCKFIFSKMNLIAEDTAEVYYSLIAEDTVFDMQKMRLDNGKWKILLF